MANAKILIVEDDKSSAAHLEECLKNLGYAVCAAVSCGREAIEKAEHTLPDLALVKLGLKGNLTGPETGKRIGSRFDVPVVYLTDEADGELLQRAQETNPFGYVLRPFEEQQLGLNIQTALYMQKRASRHKKTEIRLKRIINKYKDLTRLMKTIFNNMSEGVIAIDENRMPLFNNLSAQRIGGDHPLDKDTHKWIEKYGVFKPDGKTLFTVEGSPLMSALSGKTTEEVELFIRNALKPEGVHVSLRIKPLLGRAGVSKGFLIVFRDITKEVEAEQMKVEVERLRTELEKTSSFTGIVGTSPRMRQVYALMNQAAEGNITVLIHGESGTGKELVARSIHSNSAYKQGPFLAVDCAAIPETLIESELFGHERGAFTGATQRRIGAFERADGGTVLLDEIGDMPYALQTRLLRVLQERVVKRVGGTAPIPVDIRVIAATNKDLDRAVRKGEFREDLFYRISAFLIAIPPLRERREDIPLLVRHFIDKHAECIGKSISGISAAALHLLLQYNWPGNVRELENAIARAVLLETTSVLQVASLPPQLSPVIAAGETSSKAVILPLVEVERQALILALKVTDNNVTQAARALGINRTTLQRKLKKYDLSID